MTFVDGHPKTCLTKPGCPDKSHDKASAAARLLAGACHRELLPTCRDLWVHKVNEPRKALRDAWKQLRSAIVDGQKWSDKVTTADAKAKALAWSALGAIYHRQREYKREFLREFKGPNNAVRACASLIENALQLKKRTLPKE